MANNIKQSGEYSYIDEGSGYPIIILHGLFGGLSNFNDVLNYFKHKYRIIIPQLPLLTMPVLNTHIPAIARFIKGFMEHIKLDKAAFLGNSLGGHVSLVFAEKYPEKVDRLILTGSSGLYENAFGGSTPRKGDKEYIRNKVKVTFYDPKHATDEIVDECFAITSDRNKLIRILALAKSAIRHNMAADLPKMNMPACLIWGKNDIITPPEVAEEFKKLLPRADLYWIDKCGHAPMMEHPEEFNRILEAWLAKELN
jgi:pimeloyl-ACP methyl ester carboxylesterase